MKAAGITQKDSLEASHGAFVDSDRGSEVHAELMKMQSTILTGEVFILDGKRRYMQRTLNIPARNAI
jgi:hypothetical protein